MMLDKLNELLRGQSQLARLATSALLVAIVGCVDYFTGYELSFSVFYLIPVALSAWYGSGRVAAPVCLMSATAWLLGDVISGHQYSHPAIPLWNAAVRLGFFAVTATLLCRLREVLEIHASQAQQDGLTGIMNARAFAARYGSVANLAGRHGHSVVVGFIDLDGFKAMNDSLGHSVGDEVLKAVASTISQRIRASDCVGRLGGDEFGVLLPETGLDGARSLFAAIRGSLLALADRQGWPVGFSIGVAVFGRPPESSDEAIRLADHLMYRVKATGKNNILFEEYQAS